MSVFGIGAGTGSFLTWKVTKDYYAHLNEEEIESVKEAFKSQEQQETPITKEETETSQLDASDSLNKEMFKTYSKISQTNYGNFSKEKYNAEEMGDACMNDQKIIRPEEFGEFDDYDTIEFTFYADDNLIDENGDVVMDIENTIGYDALTKFGLYEPDTVYVRNERLQTDYIILLDQRNYADIMGNN